MVGSQRKPVMAWPGRNPKEALDWCADPSASASVIAGVYGLAVNAAGHHPRLPATVAICHTGLQVYRGQACRADQANRVPAVGGSICVAGTARRDR